MAEYEKQNQLMQMHDQMLDELLDDSSQESEVEDLVNAVYDEIGLELNKNLVNTPQTKIKAQPKATQKEKKEDPDLDALLGF